MLWWLDFLPSWSEKTLILVSHWTPSTMMQLFTDASGTIGWGAYWSGRWLQGRWTEAQLSMDINNMEGAVCYCHGCSYLGITLAEEKNTISL